MTASFVHGLDDSPLRYETVGQALDAGVQAWGSNEALIVRHQGVRWTYRELGERVDRLAAGLTRLGLEPGDRIGIWAPNCAEWTLTQFASAKAGLILVNINPAYRVAELEFALNKVGCKALVLAERFKTSDFLAALRMLAPELERAAPGALWSDRLPKLRCVIHLGSTASPGCLNFEEVLESGRPEDHARLALLAGELQPDQAVNIQFTSGTTGRPKGATLSHLNILNNGHFVGRGLELGPTDRMCIPVPLYHCFGMVMGNLACIAHGATMVYPAEWFEPRLTLEAVHAERCTVLYGVPTMFIAELDHPEFARFDLSSLRTGIMAGAPCPIEIMVIRGGENVYPREVEDFLYRHPKIQAAQVFGVPDPKYGEEVCAWVVLRPGMVATTEEIREFCREQIAHHKVPRYVRFVTEFPLTVTGKVQKFVMREQMTSLLAPAANHTAEPGDPAH
jgi:fatty-acyl-CoA synthase